MPCLPRVHPALPDATPMVMSVKVGVTFPASFRTTSQGEASPPMGRAELRQTERGGPEGVCPHAAWPPPRLSYLWVMYPFLKFFKSFKNLFNNQNNSRDIERGGSRFYRDWNLHSIEGFLRKKKYTIMSTKLETEMDAYSESGNKYKKLSSPCRWTQASQPHLNPPPRCRCSP